MRHPHLRQARAHVEYTMVRQIMRLPDPVLFWLTGGQEALGERKLDVGMQVIAFAERHMRPLHSYPLHEMRREFAHVSAMMAGPADYPVFIQNRRVYLDSPLGGRRELALRTYTPAKGPFPKPVVVYYHGGGWCVGDIDTHDVFCRFLADQTDAIVVSVDYRCAPEYPFPLPVEDCIDAFGWVVENAADFAGRPDCVLVAGDSAGGNLSAVVCQQTRERGLPQPQGQVLFYPATDLSRTHASHKECGEGYVLTADWIHWFVSNYLPDPACEALPMASPLRAPRDSLVGLPPAIVITAGFDPLRDEGEDYANALRRAGVAVTYDEFPALLHGFCGMIGVSDAAREACSMVARHIRRLLAER